MAYGQIQTFTATPQPGTSNEPFPVGNLPPFVPVTFTVTCDIAAQIAALTTALETSSNLIIGTEGLAGSLTACLNGVAAQTSNIGAIADTIKGLTKVITALEISVTNYTTSLTINNSMLAQKASTMIQANNFQTAVDAEKPTLPSVLEQMKVNLAAEQRMTGIASAIGFIEHQVITIGQSTATMITETETYKDIATWFKRQKDAFLTFITPSAKSLSNTSSASTGAPPTQG
jgi:hypothetical protein